MRLDATCLLPPLLLAACATPAAPPGLPDLASQRPDGCAATAPPPADEPWTMDPTTARMVEAIQRDRVRAEETGDSVTETAKAGHRAARLACCANLEGTCQSKYRKHAWYARDAVAPVTCEEKPPGTFTCHASCEGWCTSNARFRGIGDFETPESRAPLFGCPFVE